MRTYIPFWHRTFAVNKHGRPPSALSRALCCVGKKSARERPAFNIQSGVLGGVRPRILDTHRWRPEGMRVANEPGGDSASWGPS